MKLEIPHNCQIPNLENLLKTHFSNDGENIQKGTFVEIGAYDGVSHSNTFCLSKIGWEGIYVEPIPYFAQVCSQNHAFNKQVKVVNAAISSDKSELEMFVANTLTTSSKEQFEAYQKIDWALTDIQKFYQGNIKVPAIRLDDLLQRLSVDNVDLLVIDTEGTELDVLNSFDLQKLSPKMLICEIEDKHRDFVDMQNIRQRCEEVRRKITSANYVAVYEDEINTVFVKG